MKKLLKDKKGFTLVELLLTIALISIVFLIIYNMLFFSTTSYGKISDEVETNRELRYFLINIQKEVGQAKKANEEGPIFIKNNKYFCIHVDLDNDDKPEQVEYFIEDNELKRQVRTLVNLEENYPYTDFNNIKDCKVVLNNLVQGQNIEDIFTAIKDIKKESENSQDYEGTRKSVILKLKIKDSNEKISEYEYYLFTKSKVQFE